MYSYCSSLHECLTSYAPAARGIPAVGEVLGRKWSHLSRMGKGRDSEMQACRCGCMPDMTTPLPVTLAERIPCWRSGFRIFNQLGLYQIPGVTSRRIFPWYDPDVHFAQVWSEGRRFRLTALPAAIRAGREGTVGGADAVGESACSILPVSVP